MKIYQSFSSAETKKLGAALARRALGAKPRKKALVFALVGDLGSGKTTFIQGFLRGLGIRKKAASPTFIIFRRFVINSGSKIRDKIRDIYHIDAYRLKKTRELLALGIKEIFSDPRNVVLVEWAEKIKRILPKGAKWIKFEHGRRENERSLIFSTSQ